MPHYSSHQALQYARREFRHFYAHTLSACTAILARQSADHPTRIRSGAHQNDDHRITGNEPRQSPEKNGSALQKDGTNHETIERRHRSHRGQGK
jgi:hypothetical protein